MQLTNSKDRSYKYLILGLGIIVISTILACREPQTTAKSAPPIPVDSLSNANIEEIPEYIPPERWKEIKRESGILLDIKYASTDNFTGDQIYDCAKCFLRPELADKILQIHKDISARYDMGLKLFDCYRPRPAQKLLWYKVPDARYVTPPKKGSMHNRGLAVDLTLVDHDGNELDMGTSYDHFGPEAHTDVTYPDENVEHNRQILYKLMKLHGLRSIRTEWWHYSLTTASYPLDDWVWPCE